MGFQIKKFRKDLELTQVELAELLGVHFSTVNRWENEKWKPSHLAIDKLKIFAKENNINLDDYRTHRRRGESLRRRRVR